MFFLNNELYIVKHKVAENKILLQWLAISPIISTIRVVRVSGGVKEINNGPLPKCLSQCGVCSTGGEEKTCPFCHCLNWLEDLQCRQSKTTACWHSNMLDLVPSTVWCLGLQKDALTLDLTMAGQNFTFSFEIFDNWGKRQPSQLWSTHKT